MNKVKGDFDKEKEEDKVKDRKALAALYEKELRDKEALAR